MRHLLRILIIAIVAPSVARAAPVRPSPESNSTKLARLGAELAGLGDLENARRYCDSAITMEASNVAAAACLRDVASQEKAIGIEHSARAAQVVGARTQQLIAQAEALNRAGASDRAIEIYGAAAGTSTDPGQLEIMRARLDQAARTSFVSRLVPGWAPDLIGAILFLVGLYLLLLLVRSAARLYRVYRWEGLNPPARTRWRLRPLEDDTKLPITELLVDAILELQKEADLEKKEDANNPNCKVPTLLPLCPHEPEAHEPVVSRNFRLSKANCSPRDQTQRPLAIDFKQVTSLAEAIGLLQLKVGSVDIGGLAKFISGTRAWFDAGLPVISGSAMFTDADAGSKEVVIRLVKSDGRGDVTTIVSSAALAGELANGMDAARFAAERAAFKLQYVLARSSCSASEVDGIAAWRQAVMLLHRHATEGAAVGLERDKGLACAVRDLRFARLVEPEDNRAHRARLALFEGVSHALLATGTRTAEQRVTAIELFRTVEDIADRDKPDEALLRVQAIYNRATVEKQLNDPLSLDRALRRYEALIAELETRERSEADEAMLLLSRCGLVIATKHLPVQQFQYVLPDRVHDWLNQADLAISGIKPLSTGNSERDERFAAAVGLELHRAYASLILRAASDCHDVSLPSVSKPVVARNPECRIVDAIESLEKVARQQPPDPVLYVQLAFAYLLNGDADEARKAAQRGVTMGGKDQILYYAMAWAAYAKENFVEALLQCQAYPDRKTIPEFIDLDAAVTMKRIPMEKQRSYLGHVSV